MTKEETVRQATKMVTETRLRLRAEGKPFGYVDFSPVANKVIRSCGWHSCTDVQLPDTWAAAFRAAEAVVTQSHFHGGGSALVIRDGEVIAKVESHACQWWDDSSDDHVVVGVDDSVRVVESAAETAAGYAAIGAYKTAAKKATEEAAAEKARRKRAAELALERAELLYPYNGGKIFRARIRWALEKDIASAAKVLAKYPEVVEEGAPYMGFAFHGRKIERTIRRTYGWGPYGDEASCEIHEATKGLSQPRLDAAWKVASVLTRQD